MRRPWWLPLDHDYSIDRVGSVVSWIDVTHREAVLLAWHSLRAEPAVRLPVRHEGRPR